MLINRNKFIALVRWVNNRFTIRWGKAQEEKTRSILGEEINLAHNVRKPTALMTNLPRKGSLK